MIRLKIQDFARWQDLSGQDKIPKYPQAAEKGNGTGCQKSWGEEPPSA